MIRLHDALIRLATDLREQGVRWAVVGGFAVSLRAIPRTTRDLDVAIAVAHDGEAERIVTALVARGFSIESVLEQKDVGRMATVRLLAPGGMAAGIIVDLLFASSGVETEIVQGADLIEIEPGLAVPIASMPHLAAMKVLASRSQDRSDVRALLRNASPLEMQATRRILDLIARRGFDRGNDLNSVLDRILTEE